MVIGWTTHDQFPFKLRLLLLHTFLESQIQSYISSAFGSNNNRVKVNKSCMTQSHFKSYRTVLNTHRYICQMSLAPAVEQAYFSIAAINRDFKSIDGLEDLQIDQKTYLLMNYVISQYEGYMLIIRVKTVTGQTPLLQSALSNYILLAVLRRICRYEFWSVLRIVSLAMCSSVWQSTLTSFLLFIF